MHINPFGTLWCLLILGHFCSKEGHLMSCIREKGDEASMSPENHPHMPYFADLPGLCLFTYILSPVAMDSLSSWISVHATGSALLCTLSVPHSFCIVGLYLMTAASLPCGMLIPILYVSLLREMGCAILIVGAFPSM